MDTKKDSFKRISFTGNILRVGSDSNNKQTNQSINISWLHSLLGGTLEYITGLETEMVTWEKGSKFDSKFVYDAQGLPVNMESFSYLHNSKKMHQIVLDYFKFYFSESLVVGIELSPFMVKIFDKLDIPYIDFMFHPARFMNDLVLGVRTNLPGVYKLLEKYRLPEERIHAEAGLRKARLVKAKKYSFEENSAMFAGQVQNDSSLIHESGGFISIFDHEDSVKNIVDTHSDKLFKPHPYNKDKRYNELFLDLGFKVVGGNFYELISQDTIVSVYALTSSVVYESRYFGKQSRWLSQYPFDYGDKNRSFNKFRYVPMMGSFLNPKFWTLLFSDGFMHEVKKGSDLEVSSNLIGEVRKSLNIDWGYGVFK